MSKKTQDPVLQVSGLSKVFNGFVAVDAVDLSIQQGHIHALIGPNGAGKTTCFNLLTKFIKPSAGIIRYLGEDITNYRPAQIARKGIIRSFQISAVFPGLSVRDNVRIALQRNTGTSFHFWRSDSCLNALESRVMGLLDEVGLADCADQPTIDLPYGRKRALEIATTLAMEPSLLLLDEPTQGMGHEDVDRITNLIKHVGAGRTILIVEHNMRVVASIADRITVLARGVVLAEGDYQAVSNDPAVIEAYMGVSEDSLVGDTA